MNLEKQIEKEIWLSLLVMAENFEDFDKRTYVALNTIDETLFDKVIDRVERQIMEKVSNEA